MQTCPQQRTPEWFRQRSGLLTASKFSSALGHNKWEPALNAFLDLAHARAPTLAHQTEAMKRGIEMEPIAIALYESQTGKKVKHGGLFIKEGLGGSPDGWTEDGTLIEVKTPMKPRPHLDLEYNDQIQGLMWIMDLPRAELVVYYPQGLQILRIPRDPLWEKNELPRLKMFVEIAKKVKEEPNPESKAALISRAGFDGNEWLDGFRAHKYLLSHVKDPGDEGTPKDD